MTGVQTCALPICFPVTITRDYSCASQDCNILKHRFTTITKTRCFNCTYFNTFNVVSIDKDLDQFVGWHYNPKKKIRYLISPNDAIRFFYYQMLVGDTADNVKGVKGIGPKKAERILANCETEEEMFDTVRDLYNNDEEMLMNGKVLWLWQKENDIWTPMKELNGNQTEFE